MKTASTSNKTKHQAAPNTFSFIEPMKAFPVPDLPDGWWLYEVKLEGYRALAFKTGEDTRLFSRNQVGFNYPELINALKLLPVEHFIVDGEISPPGSSTVKEHRSSGEQIVRWDPTARYYTVVTGLRCQTSTGSRLKKRLGLALSGTSLNSSS